MTGLLGLLGLIAILLPLAAALVMAMALTLGRRLPEALLDGILRVSFGGSLLACLGVDVLVASGAGTTVTLAHWLVVPSYVLDATLVFDAPAAVMMTLTAALCAAVGAFSAPYLHRDPGYRRFFVLLPLFASGMMAVAAGNTLDLIYAGWEVVGLASALLIAYFHEREAPVRHGLRAFAVYRLCDVALLAAAVLHHSHTTPEWVVPVLLVLASMGKAAAFPFTGWLPRAMEGPTPSSAIFYGALSIHAGPFLLIRSWPLLQDVHVARALLVAIGVVTALHATTVGRVQTDIKSLLGYRSAAQAGCILVEIGLGWTDLALAHMAAHAVLRTWQILRAPSLLEDRPAPAWCPWEQALPPGIRRWAYRLAVERWFVDDLAAHRLSSPLLRVLAALDRPDPAREPAPFAIQDVPRASWSVAFGVIGGVLIAAAGVVAGLPRAVVAGIALVAAFAVLPKRHVAPETTAALLALAAVDLALVQAPPGPAQATLFALHGALVLVALRGSASRLALPYLVASGACALLGTALGGAGGAVLLLFAVALAMGVPPFHSWVVGTYTRAPTTVAVAVTAPMPAVALIAWEPLGLGGLTPIAAALLAVAAGVSAALILVQAELARAVALLTVSVGAVVLLALLDTDRVGHLGGLMMWNVTGLALLGLGLVSAVLRARTGAVRIDRYTGLAKQAPVFAGLFLLFGLSAVGAPGTADFASEDLVLHGGLAHDPLLVVLLISAISMQGYAVLHLFFRAFYGPPSRLPLADALPRERVALVAVALLLIGTGLAPQLLVDGLSEEQVAEAP